MAPPHPLSKRDCSEFDGSYCTNGGIDYYGVHYAIVALIFIAIAVLLFGAYFHAQRRVRKGLPPRAYHRWLISRRRYRATPFQQPQNNYAYYQSQQDPAYPPQQGYPMQNMGGAHGAVEFQPPPPAYGNWEAPPVYQPPQGASKVAANQGAAMPVVGGEGGSASLPLNNNNANHHTQ
jgi:hypothetical protein